VAGAEFRLDCFPDGLHLIERKHNEQRLSRLSALEYFGTKCPVDRRATFKLPDAATIKLLEQDMDT